MCINLGAQYWSRNIQACRHDYHRCAIIGVPWRGSVSACFAWNGLFVSLPSAEKAEPRVAGTPMMVHLQLPEWRRQAVQGFFNALVGDVRDARKPSSAILRSRVVLVRNMLWLSDTRQMHDISRETLCVMTKWTCYDVTNILILVPRSHKPRSLESKCRKHY